MTIPFNPVVFDTARGRCMGEYCGEDLSLGFVLREYRIPDDLDWHLWHLAHGETANELLRISGVMKQPQMCSEVQWAKFGSSVLPHVDGLKGRYFQVHTTLPTHRSAAATSLISIYAAPAAEDIHQYMCDLHIKYPDSGPNVPQYFRSFEYGDRFKLKLIHQAGFFSTIIFPNGYPADVDAEPIDLVLHSGESMRADNLPSSNTDFRDVHLSRIEDQAK